MRRLDFQKQCNIIKRIAQLFTQDVAVCFIHKNRIEKNAYDTLKTEGTIHVIEIDRPEPSALGTPKIPGTVRMLSKLSRMSISISFLLRARVRFLQATSFRHNLFLQQLAKLFTTIGIGRVKMKIPPRAQRPPTMTRKFLQQY